MNFTLICKGGGVVSVALPNFKELVSKKSLNNLCQEKYVILKNNNENLYLLQTTT
jgi:hypothetical protein